MVLKAARRYAKAFLQIAIEQDNVASILEDVQMVKNTIDSSRDLTLFLKSPIIKSDDKRKALDEIFDDKIQPITQQFLTLLVRKGRENLLEQIMDGFIESYHDHAGIIEISVYSAMELSDKQKKRITDTLEKVTHKQAELEYHLDEELMGGLAVRIDDTVIDGTVRNKINRLKTLLTEASVV